MRGLKPLAAKDVRPDCNLTVGGSIKIGNAGYIHPLAFKALFGDEAFQEVLRRPRVVSEYDSWTEFAQEDV